MKKIMLNNRDEIPDINGSAVIVSVRHFLDS